MLWKGLYTTGTGYDGIIILLYKIFKTVLLCGQQHNIIIARTI